MRYAWCIGHFFNDSYYCGAVDADSASPFKIKCDPSGCGGDIDGTDYWKKWI